MPLLRDGVKKGLILGVTAPWPHGLRVGARERWLGALEVGIARRARMILIAHPKSGNTWLKTMISRIYQVRHGLADDVMHKSDEYTRRHPEIPRLAATNGWYSYEGAVGRALAADGGDPEVRSKPVLLLARNPADIAVSWYHQFTKRQSAAKQELINASIDHPIDRNTIQMWEFVRHSDIGLPFLIEFLNTWERRLAELPNGRLLRYEELRADPATHLRQVMEFMGETVSDDEIAEAVRFGSVDNLRGLESQGHFKQGGLTLRDASDPNSFKVRRAKVGGFRDDFPPEQVAELEELMRKHLSPSLGYGEPADAGRAEG